MNQYGLKRDRGAEGGAWVGGRLVIPAFTLSVTINSECCTAQPLFAPAGSLRRSPAIPSLVLLTVHSSRCCC
ncbi:hypothetical protein E2C01_011864 [Portunus trituberculatus]|uniref:Uncharacterized protein n=1 Tax=Portunus trituberculatus TaxID=210409 RepID=A0A5B7DCH0_PORTR|nr:hypothetical protein [Portunus trituberculatus]